MPVFQESAHAARDLRILPSRALPLPRLSPHLKREDSGEKYEVVVIGAGPAGLFLTLNLSRLGLGDESLICFDAKPGTLKAGQADGLQPRTLEVLKSLGLADEILSEGCHMSEVAFWNPSKTGEGIERTSFVPDVAVATRYQHEVTIHQGRIERILEENLRLYSKRSIVFSSRFAGFHLDSGSDPGYPLDIEVEQTMEDGSTIRKHLRSKYLVGADGAHSKVRQAMNLKLEGETTDHIWGVVDFIADTDFPDIRKRSAIHSSAGSIMVIPRERIYTGEHLTRMYVQIKDEVSPDIDGIAEVSSKEAQKIREKRAAITLDYIFSQAERVLKPYKIRIRQGTAVDWWAAYQIGQRMTPSFSMKDKNGIERVFIVGDACHTHSPKAGQGMNVSMMDSYNLSWKLVHSIHGLTPRTSPESPDPIVSSFEHERLTVARQLIEFDSKFSSMFSGAIGGQDSSVESLTHEQFLKVFSDGNGFTSGCGIEYPDGLLVRPAESSSKVIHGTNFLNGTLRTGRRLLNVKVRRFADANLRHLQDDFLSTGRYRILVLASDDILKSSGESATTIERLCLKVLPSFPSSVIELVVIHPFAEQRFEWTDIPTSIKKHAEMRFHGVGLDDVYGIYGVDVKKGAVAVVRPDGYVGSVCALPDVAGVLDYLSHCLARVSEGHKAATPNIVNGA